MFMLCSKLKLLKKDHIMELSSWVLQVEDHLEALQRIIQRNPLDKELH